VHLKSVAQSNLQPGLHRDKVAFYPIPALQHLMGGSLLILIACEGLPKRNNAHE